jgi:hypothetical protein
MEGFVNIKDIATVPPPEHLPDAIRAAFLEDRHERDEALDGRRGPDLLVADRIQ